LLFVNTNSFIYFSRKKLREALFIKKNKDRWLQYSNSPSTVTDEVAKEFIELTDDLGYAKTFYPHSAVTKFLNAEAAKKYLHIYTNRREDKNRIKLFFVYDVPMVIAKHLWVLAGCFAIFIFFFFVGFYSAKYDENFIREILGDAYVNMTEKNIAEGNPFGVYKTGNSFLVFLGIMINNISVSFRYYMEGLLFPFFTIQELIRDGIMVGSFDYMFYAKGLGNQFLLTVMLHGILELSAIVVAAAAGVILGKSWLFPGTYTRLYAFKQGAKESIKIIIGLVPVFTIAAFFEGFVTRHSGMPLWLNLALLMASLFFVVFYFVVYPIQLKRKLKNIA
jgi:uncharacterized membrane protein SpoIIM required for sporulation